MNDLANNRRYLFTVKDSDDADLSCHFEYTHFVYHKDSTEPSGSVYFNGYDNKGIYKLDPTNVTVNNTATASLVETASPLFNPKNISGFSLTDDYIYYTDLEYHRVIRNKRQ